MTPTKALLAVRFAAVLVGALADAVRFAVDDWLDAGSIGTDPKRRATPNEPEWTHRPARRDDDIDFDDHAPS